jgi:hypothetical protein
MFSRKTLPVWVGVLLLSGMFFMGQQAWEPQPPQCEEWVFPTCDGWCLWGSYDCVDPSAHFIRLSKSKATLRGGFARVCSRTTSILTNQRGEA